MDNMNKPTFPQGIYGITAEKFSKGRSNIEVVQQMIAGGIGIIQYREKRPHKSFAEMLSECKAIRTLTREAGVLFIINDYADIAQLVDADGVHVGQDDFPVPEVRRLIGPHKLIGLSTHSPEQAEAAIAAGADAFITGEISEPQAHLARESGVAFIAAGHHATERYGAPAVAAHVAAQLGLEHRFIDIDNPA